MNREKVTRQHEHRNEERKCYMSTIAGNYLPNNSDEYC